MGLITYTNLADGTPVTANVFNERFAQIIAQLNGNLDSSNFKDAGILKADLASEVYQSIYPVGSMYVNFTNNTNPATLLGFGTWTAVAGRVVVGYDGTQTEFNASEKTGGHKDYQAHAHTLGAPLAGGGSWSGYTYTAQVAIYNGVNTMTTGTSGTGDSGNLQPYIVGYVWKRIS